MKLYVRFKNQDNDSFDFIMSDKSKVEILKRCLDKLPQEFLNSGVSARIYVSETGFDSQSCEYLDTHKVMRKAGW